MRTAIGGYKKAVPTGDPVVDTAELEVILASMLPDGVDPATMSLEAVAKRAELSPLYEGYYRSLSHAHAHPSLLSLASINIPMTIMRTKGVRWGPGAATMRHEDFLMVVCVVMYNLPAQWGSLLVQVHGANQFHQRIERIGFRS
jgi:hypothetical protein